jgi:capsular polysaccharide biosynthesis protein
MDHTIDLREIVHAVKKRILMIIGITAFCTAAAVLVSNYVLKPVYEAKTSIIISKPSTGATVTTTYNDVLMYQNLIRTYSEIAKSKSVAKLAAEKLGNKYTAQEIMNASEISPETNTQIMTISAVSGTPEAAKDIAKALSDSFIAQSTVFYPSGNVLKVIDEAETPQTPVQPNKRLNTILGLILGLLLSGGTVVLLEYMDRSIRTEEDVAKYLNDLPVVGIIPKDVRR